MNWIDWLDRYARGLQALIPDQREAITYFSFLRTMFEARVLSTRANANAIVEASLQWASKDLLASDTFGQELALFSRPLRCVRYTRDSLRSSASSAKRCARTGEGAKPEEVVAAVMIIVYRFR